MLVGLQDLNFDKYDVLIAGSGLAAWSVAKQANEFGKTTLMIETGDQSGDPAREESLLDVRGRGHYTGSHWRNHWFRDVGGTSALWAGWLGALTERDTSSWPINYEEFLPFLAIAANDLGRAGLFIQYSKPFIQGFEYRPISTPENYDPLVLAHDVEKHYERNARSDLLPGSTVARLHPNSDRRGIQAVTLTSWGREERRVSLRDGQVVVLAAGGLGNPQILLSSDEDGDSVAVGNVNDQVGRYLMEHPHFYDCGRVVVPADISFPTLPADFGASVDVITTSEDLYEAVDRLDVQVEWVEATPSEDDKVEAFLLDRIGSDAKVFNVIVRSEMPAERSNRVTVRDGLDIAGMRRLKTSCAVSSSTFRAVDETLEFLAQALIASGSGRMNISNSIYETIAGGGHTMGTTRMGDNPRDSVVDGNCRVHGYSNLFIAGSSVFRTGGAVNPTLNLMALASRLGQYIGRDFL